jgi:anti-anti-sigma factor
MTYTRVVQDDSQFVARDRGEFAVVVVEEAGQIVAHVTGEIDLATCERLRDAIEPHLGRGQRVVLDLSDVRFMDSSCLKVLLHAHTTLTGDGGSLVLRNPSDFAKRVLSLSGLTDLFDIEVGQPATGVDDIRVRQ